MISFDELRASARVVDLPLRAPFRGLLRREALLFEGPSGWAEWAPFANHSDAHSARWLAAAIEQGFGSWPQPLRGAIRVNAILPEVSAAESGEWAAAKVREGYDTFKLKVGGDLKLDLERVAAVREAIGAANLRLDANGKWSLERALSYIPQLLEVAGEVQYFEQPADSLRDCAAIRRELGVRIAVDEGLRLAADPSSIAEAIVAAADVMVLKAIPLGGVRPALDLADAVGLPVVVSGSLDTSVGLAAGLALAAALPELPYACGLGTADLFAADVVTPARAAVGGMVAVGRSVVQPDLLERFAAAPEVKANWLERLERCHALLVSDQRESL